MKGWIFYLFFYSVLEYPRVRVAEGVDVFLVCPVFVLKSKPEYGEGAGRQGCPGPYIR